MDIMNSGGTNFEAALQQPVTAFLQGSTASSTTEKDSKGTLAFARSVAAAISLPPGTAFSPPEAINEPTQDESKAGSAENAAVAAGPSLQTEISEPPSEMPLGLKLATKRSYQPSTIIR